MASKSESEYTRIFENSTPPLPPKHNNNMHDLISGIMVRLFAINPN